MENNSKPTRQELEEAYRVRIESESRPLRTEEDRKIAQERIKEIDEYINKHLRD
ncbi:MULTISPECIES: hypothetical protein [Aerococcus]|uniref:hypothetical protein n=1 Tax=Aerococcus TaxID=1375 RepID=UPI0015EC03F2|nr:MULTISPECIES: hypothetical protein [Aerococcus]MDK8133220.1 hypothetical protein [Aerococcus urinae]MDK8485371.1 hypothetical protein [Aerococcus urinae]MDL5178308.1 hypothetical protein [Aerococcus tenax]MDL5207323.1 hypothetical protein [Aerococcus tenax]WIW73924.1 hypothetical protein DBT50_009350 [Aerococcus tenax]